MNSEKTTQVLNDLIHILQDRLIGFENVEGKVWEGHPELKGLYEQMVTQTKIMKTSLINLIQDLRGEYSEHQTISGALHQTWISIKNSLLFDNIEKSTLREVLYGENAAIQIYQQALDENILEGSEKTIVAEQLRYIKDSAHQFQGVLENIEAEN